MTDEATRFVGAVTFSALASEPVQTSLWDEASPIPHTRLGQTADLIVIAPATAHLIARYAAGLSDDLLTATLLATRAPVLICPAMHTEMWEHPSVQENLATLQRRGVSVVPPESGRLAGGDSGEGRLADPSDDRRPGTGHGGTGRMRAGSAPPAMTWPANTSWSVPVAPARATRPGSLPDQSFLGQAGSCPGGRGGPAWGPGHPGHLVCTLPLPADVQSLIERVPVESAADMEAAMSTVCVEGRRGHHGGGRGGLPAQGHGRAQAVEGRRATRVGARADAGHPGRTGRPPHRQQVLVGFAAETNDVLERGRRKLARKGVDLLVVNDVSAPDVGFDHDTNAVTILGADGSSTEVHAFVKECSGQCRIG